MAQETLVNVFWERVRTSPDRPAILHKVAGSYHRVIWREHGRVVELMANALLHQGVARGEKVAIMSTSRPQWTWADLSILSAGAVTVPIYPTLGLRDVEYCLAHSDAVGIFLENMSHLDTLLACKEMPPSLRFVVLIDGGGTVENCPVPVFEWDEMLKIGEAYIANHPGELAERINAVRPDDVATIVYTSGTTGLPKGAMLLHKNIYHVCQSLSLLVGFHPDDITLSFLPLSHVFERIGGQFLSIYEGLVLAYAESMETVGQNMLEVRPTIITGVPRFFEKVYHRVVSEVRKMPVAQQFLIRWALALGKRAARAAALPDTGGQVLTRRIMKAELRVAERMIYSRIRRKFGGRLRFMVSGAAPLSKEVRLFFESIGIPVVEGYGLTETAAPVTCNTPSGNRPGTVGRPLPGVEVKIASDGEILVRGPNVFSGYYKNTAATADAFKEGWFLTGDIGEFDEDGNLMIKDRKKDIIITSGGKHVAPQYVENLFVGEPLVSHVLVYGDRRKYITALVTLNKDGLAVFARANNLSYSSVDELNHHPTVLKELDAVVERKNQGLPTFEQIKRFIVLDNDFSVERNELTPTLKVKRSLVTTKYKALLDSLYEIEDLALEGFAEK